MRHRLVKLALLFAGAAAVATAAFLATTLLFAQTQTSIPPHIQVVAAGDHPINVDIDSLDFGDVAPGDTVNRSFHITNPSSTAAAQVGFSIEGAGPPSVSHKWQGGTSNTIVIAPQDTAKVDFTIHTFLSTPVGNYNYSIVLLSSDAP